jgi:hypothetical protein
VSNPLRIACATTAPAGGVPPGLYSNHPPSSLLLGTATVKHLRIATTQIKILYSVRIEHQLAQSSTSLWTFIIEYLFSNIYFFLSAASNESIAFVCLFLLILKSQLWYDSILPVHPSLTLRLQQTRAQSSMYICRVHQQQREKGLVGIVTTRSLI